MACRARALKTIGLLGGMGWASTIDYYRIINEEAARRLGGLHSARVILYSFEYKEIYQPQAAGRDHEIVEKFVTAAQWLKNAGADFFLLGANTAHMHADAVQKQVSIPLLHITDVTAKAILSRGLSQVGLLGTRYTMQRDFYKDRLKRHGITALVPNAEDIEATADIITYELNQLKILPESRRVFVNTMDRLKAAGAQGVILGCTEIPLLIQQQHHSLPLFDTTRLHATAAVDEAFQ